MVKLVRNVTRSRAEVTGVTCCKVPMELTNVFEPCNSRWVAARFFHIFKDAIHSLIARPIGGSSHAGAGFLSELPVNLKLAVKAKILFEKRSAFRCPSAHFNPIAIAA